MLSSFLPPPLLPPQPFPVSPPSPPNHARLRGGAQGGGRGSRRPSGLPLPPRAPVLFSAPATENANTLPRTHLNGRGAAKGLKCNLFLFVACIIGWLWQRVLAIAARRHATSRNKLHFNPFAAPLRFVRGRVGRGEIALQHSITEPELAPEGVKTGSDRLAGCRSHLTSLHSCCCYRNNPAGGR